MDRSKSGFTLPTVMIVSIIMFGVLALAMQLVSQSTSSQRDIYYRQLAREAVESGTIHAQECLRLNGYVASWTAAKPLRPNTDCSGNVVSGSSMDIVSSSTVQSRYEVGLPQRSSAGAQRIGVVARVNLLSSGTSSVWNSYTVTEYVNVGATTSFDTVSFGYEGSSGAFFSSIYPNGSVSSVGYNGSGQLGTASYTSPTKPTLFRLPSGHKATSVYTSFLSNGSRVYVATDQGDLYGAGLNNYGQLGDGTLYTSRTTPVRYGLPVGVSARNVSLLAYSTFVVASNGSIYSSGDCSDGVLGTGCTSGSRPNPTRVSMPTVNFSNSNTIPGTGRSDIVSDRNTVFVRMQGGAVYGWGGNDRGQLGDGTTINRSTPVRVGTFGNTGWPKITKLAFDGDTLYMLDDSGNVWTTGSNGSGALAGAAARFKLYGSNGTDGLCLDSTGVASGGQLKASTCNTSVGQKFEWVPHTENDAVNSSSPTSRGAIRSALSPTLCLKVRGTSAGTANANLTPVELAVCDTSNEQFLWQYRSSGRSILWSSSGSRCLDKSSSNTAQIYNCNGTGAQWWTLEDINIPTKVPLPAGRKATDIATDQWSVLILLDNGKVMGAGDGTMGQLGAGSGIVDEFNPALRYYRLPAGSVVRSIYTTRFSDVANSYAVLSNGSVYGSGRNASGQLGIGSSSSSFYSVPVKMGVFGSSVVAKSIQSGLGTTVILTNEGQIYTVGNNSHGQLGDGTKSASYTPGARPYANVLPPIIY